MIGISYTNVTFLKVVYIKFSVLCQIVLAHTFLRTVKTLTGSFPVVFKNSIRILSNLLVVLLSTVLHVVRPLVPPQTLYLRNHHWFETLVQTI